MSIFDGYADAYDGNARLIILKALAEQDDGRLNDTLLMEALKAFAINKSREYLLTQLGWLQEQASAVVVHQVGSAVVAELTEVGENHLARTALIVGVQKPSSRRR